MSFFI